MTCNLYGESYATNFVFGVRNGTTVINFYAVNGDVFPDTIYDINGECLMAIFYECGGVLIRPATAVSDVLNEDPVIMCDPTGGVGNKDVVIISVMDGICLNVMITRYNNSIILVTFGDGTYKGSCSLGLVLFTIVLRELFMVPLDAYRVVIDLFSNGSMWATVSQTPMPVSPTKASMSTPVCLRDSLVGL